MAPSRLPDIPIEREGKPMLLVTPDDNKELDQELQDRERGDEVAAMADVHINELDHERACQIEKAEDDLERHMADLEREMAS